VPGRDNHYWDYVFKFKFYDNDLKLYYNNLKLNHNLSQLWVVWGMLRSYDHHPR